MVSTRSSTRAGDDLPRARRFYEKVFGWTFQAWGPPGFYMISTGLAPATPLLQGSLQQRREIVKGVPMRGFECTISVADIQATAVALEANGATIVTSEPLSLNEIFLELCRKEEGREQEAA